MTETAKNIISDNKRIIVIALLTSIGTWYATYVNSNQFKVKTNEENTQVLIDNMQDQMNRFDQAMEKQDEKINALTTLYEDCSQKNTTLRIENEKLKSEILISNADLDNIPYPIWIKGVDGRMIYINDAYNDLVLKPIGKDKLDYIGVRDEEIWGKETAKIYKKNFDKVLAEKRPVSTRQVVKYNDKKYLFDLTKYPIMVNGKIVAIGGIINQRF